MRACPRLLALRPAVMQAAAARQTFALVQALRAAAALSVAFSHICHDALLLQPASRPLLAVYRAMPWGAGVDIFFVISGFVIVTSSQTLFARARAPARFLARRVARIVPLYWLMTTLFLLNAWVLPQAINGAIGGPAYILKSYLFLPCARADGSVQPVFSLGWTLNYEMFFYLVFTGFLMFRERYAVVCATALLGGFVLMGRCGLLAGVVLQTWSNPIILEFCAGMLLALLPGRVRLALGPRLLLVLAAVLLLHAAPPALPRVFGWGLAAAALVFAATSGGGSGGGGKPVPERWLMRLGDASYALYLVHPFIMRGVALLWRQAHRPGGVFSYVVLCLLLAQLAALAIHYGFERRSTAFVRRKLEAVFLKNSQAKNLLLDQ